MGYGRFRVASDCLPILRMSDATARACHYDRESISVEPLARDHLRAKKLRTEGWINGFDLSFSALRASTEPMSNPWMINCLGLEHPVTPKSDSNWSHLIL
jgi:hypothetical protein